MFWIDYMVPCMVIYPIPTHSDCYKYIPLMPLSSKQNLIIISISLNINDHLSYNSKSINIFPLHYQLFKTLLLELFFQTSTTKKPSKCSSPSPSLLLLSSAPSSPLPLLQSSLLPLSSPRPAAMTTSLLATALPRSPSMTRTACASWASARPPAMLLAREPRLAPSGSTGAALLVLLPLPLSLLLAPMTTASAPSRLLPLPLSKRPCQKRIRSQQ